MTNTLLGAILLAIASPAQVLLTVIGGLIYGFEANRISNSKKVYPHLEIREISERIEFCLRVYGPDHRETVVAYAQRQDLFERYCKEKLLTLEDQRMYLATRNLIRYN